MRDAANGSLAWVRLVTLSLVVAGPACAAKSVRSIRGTWELVPPNGGRYDFSVTDRRSLPLVFTRLMIRGGDAPGSVIVNWPTGLGCQDEYGTFDNGVITIPARTLPGAVPWRIVFTSSSRARFFVNGDPAGEVVLFQRVSRIEGPPGCE